MVKDFVRCQCGTPMRLETIAPGRVDTTMILTYHCADCDKRRRFILAEIVLDDGATKLRATK